MINVKDAPYSAKGDIASIASSGVTIAAGSPNLTVAGANFVSTDVGKLIVVPGAGASGGDLSTSIAAFTDATHVVLSANAGTALAAAAKTVVYGADDTSAIQAAVTAAVAAGDEVFFPRGNYGLSAQVYIAGAVTIRSTNSSVATITFMNLAANGFFVDTQAKVQFLDLTFASASKQTGGASIQIYPSSGENYFSVVRGCVFQNVCVGVDVTAASYYKIEDNYITATLYGLRLRNLFNADHGDGRVCGNTLLQDSNTGTGVLWESGGGLRFIDNKINGYFIGMLFNQASNGSTSILLIEGNSIENQGQQGVCFQRNGSATLWHVVISDNHFAGTPLGVNFSTVDSLWPINVVLEGNVVLLNSYGQQGFNIAGGANVNVGPNAIHGGGAPSNSTGIIVGSSVGNGVIGFQAYRNLSTNIINNSSGVTVH